MSATLVDGAPVAVVSADDRGLAYGDGLFETIAWRGRALRFAGRHWDRLRNGSARLGLPPPPLAAIERDIVELAPEADGVVKVMWTRGSGPRGYAPPAEPRPSRIVSYAPSAASLSGAWTGVMLRTPAATHRGLAGLKTLNRLDSVLARRELAVMGAEEGLMADAHGRLVGGTSSNLFLVSGDHLETPDLADAGIHGVMRAVVIDSARALGLLVQTVPLAPARLLSAQAAFVTNALIGVRPLDRLDGRVLDSSGHPLVRAIMQALLAQGVGECAES